MEQREVLTVHALSVLSWGDQLFLESIHGNGRKLTVNERGILQSLEGRIRWNYNAQKVHDPPPPHPRREIMACPLLSN